MPLTKPNAKKPATKPTKRVAARNPSADARRKAFIEAYLSNGHNATQAAIAAGYSARTATEQGSRLLTNVQVQAVLQTRAKEAAEAAKLSTDDVMRQLRATLLFDPRKLFDEHGQLKPVSELDDDTAAALTSIEVDELYEGAGKDRVNVGQTKKVKWLDKNTAREQAMKHFGLFERDNNQQAERVKVLVMPGGKDAPLEPPGKAGA